MSEVIETKKRCGFFSIEAARAASLGFFFLLRKEFEEVTFSEMSDVIEKKEKGLDFFRLEKNLKKSHFRRFPKL